MNSAAPAAKEMTDAMRHLHLFQGGKPCAILALGASSFVKFISQTIADCPDCCVQGHALEQDLDVDFTLWDAVVVDYVPTADFLEAVRAFITKTPTLPILVLVDDLDAHVIHQLFDLGVADLLVRAEVTPLHLRRVISYALQSHNHEVKARAFEERHRGIVENASEGIFQTTPQGRYLLANPALAKLYGYEDPDCLVRDLTNIAHQLYVEPERRLEFKALMDANDRVRNFESRIRRKDGRIIWISENARAVRNSSGEVLYFEGFVRDISQRREHEEKLRYLAQRDPLTGLPNRALFKDRLNEAIERAKKNQSRAALLFIDLDNFKSINDTMGHVVGDKILQKVAHRLLTCTDTRDTVARLSGDEFVVILEDVKDRDAVLEKAQDIVGQLNLPHSLGQTDLYVSGSVGVSLYPDNAADGNEMIQNVDTAANHAKKHGRNTIKFYSAILSEQARRRLDLENGLRTALENDELSLFYQPKVNMTDGTVIGSEALLRWNSAELGFVPPDEFIPIAEETGLILPIGDWIIHTVCQQLRDWMDKGLMPGSVAVNIAAEQFKRGNILDTVRDALCASKVEAHYFEVELTESALVTHISDTVSALTQLAGLGVRTSVDDFGTGYSSLSYLKKFPISTLKIDRSFIMDIPHDGESAAIARAIVSLGHSLDLSIVAEGIETEAQWQFMQALGCQYGQGYMFSRPVAAQDFEEMLMEGAREYQQA